jgi:transposase InsO family protein
MPRPAAEALQQAAKPKASKERAEETVSLVSMNFRVPASIPAGLLKASSERKMKKTRPFTQQDIVAEALTAWRSCINNFRISGALQTHPPTCVGMRNVGKCFALA